MTPYGHSRGVKVVGHSSVRMIICDMRVNQSKEGGASWKVACVRTVMSKSIFFSEASDYSRQRTAEIKSDGVLIH